MARRARGLAARLLRALAFGGLAVLVVLALAVALFPFERLAPALAARIQRETGVATRIETLRPSFGPRGPALEARGVTLRWPTGETLALDSVHVRAARPLAWLRGVPTVHVSTAAPFGAFDGDVSRELLAGDFARFDFAQLPASWFGGSGSPLAGAIDARVDFGRASEAWTGKLSLTGGEGSLALPGSPVAIPYERLDAGARLDGAGTLHLDSLSLAGPMVSARATGALSAGAAGLASGALAIDAAIERLDPALLPALAQYGIALDERGAGRISISGTAGQIELR